MPLSSADTRRNTLRVTEIYKSIQGESTWAGLPCIFVRLARCHLRCVWCDTAYAFYGGESVAIADIVAKCREMDCRLVEITGGEPLVQAGCIDLAQALLDAGFTVLIETSGSLPIDVLPAAVIKIMDLKCPDSGECGKNHWPNIEALSPSDEVKFVIASRRDYEWARDRTHEHGLVARCNAVLFSPVFGRVAPVDLARWILADGLEVRLQLQLHKFIWPPEERGV
jgi:7-carboxy-7-deazaguanine synthase